MELASKKLVILALFSLLCFTMLSTNSAKAAVMFTIDNDSNTYHNWSNPTGSWTYLHNGNYSDSEIHYGGGYNSSIQYGWDMNPGNYGSSLTMSVYLNNASFNNPYADYWANSSYITHIDQNTAGAWTPLWPTVQFRPNVENYFWVTAADCPADKNTGADTIMFSY